MPPWAVTQIERLIYDFFWNYKHPLVNRNILALPLGEGGFNIPLLQTRIHAFRLTTLKRLLSGEDAHWKHFTAYFLRVANMKLGKMTLVLDYSPQRIDRDIPAFHKELLMACHKHKECHTRARTPESVTDILNEPLFLNELIKFQEKPLIYTDWITAGLTQIKDICYEAVPGLLPVAAIHEMLTDRNPRTLSRTSQELKELLAGIPQQWIQLIRTSNLRPPPTVQPSFLINNLSPGSTPTDLQACKTRNFYQHLHQVQKPSVPALDRWNQLLQPEPVFNVKQWRTLYSPLVTNKQGDINWKITHRVLPTALSLNRMGVSESPDCHRCGVTDTIEHALLECTVVVAFWNYIQSLINKISDNCLPLTAGLKLLGKVPREDDLFSRKHADLINWTLTIARYSIYKSALYHRLDNVTIPPEPIFVATVKSHVRFQFKLYSVRQTLYYFPYDWCLGEALAKVEDNKLLFTI